MTQKIAERNRDLLNALESFNPNSLSRDREISQILSIADSLLRTEEGLDQLFDSIDEIESKDIFRGTSWGNPGALIPSLVEGTLKSGFPMVIYESLSELRMLAIATGKLKHDRVSPDEAMNFVKTVLINNLKYVPATVGHVRDDNSTNPMSKRMQLLFRFILSHLSLDSLKKDLVAELHEMSQQRPIVGDKFRSMVSVARQLFDTDAQDEHTQLLNRFINSIYAPSILSRESKSTKDYLARLKALDDDELVKECKEMAFSMQDTGLVSRHHLILLKYLVGVNPELIPVLLDLSAHGKADFEMHADFISEKIIKSIDDKHLQSIYGLSKMLNRTLLSRKSIFNAFRKLITTRMHIEVKRRLLKKEESDSDELAGNILMCGLVSLLGQPLGIGQGYNPTCQSARGLSMWSRHSPGKLLNMLISVVASNELRFRFHSEIIHSKGIVDEQKFDYELDPVSIVLVPHLDDVYGQMMARAQAKFPGQDPHVTVNPAFYGLWIQTGFVSCYNPLLNVIQDYENFVKLFYAAFHPMYNGAANLIYPIPLGIFITNSHGDFLGYHAISLLRVAKTEDGDFRAYFYNPNNEGRQNWGQGIKTTVSGNGERHGESSLPFHQFISRVYAFHYNSFEAESHLEYVDSEEIERVEKLARNSWGRNYFWDKN